MLGVATGMATVAEAFTPTRTGTGGGSRVVATATIAALLKDAGDGLGGTTGRAGMGGDRSESMGSDDEPMRVRSLASAA
jgi:hypothetical protein